MEIDTDILVKNISDEDHKHYESLNTLRLESKSWFSREVCTDAGECLYKTKMYKHNFPQDITCNAEHFEFLQYFPDLH